MKNQKSKRNKFRQRASKNQNFDTGFTLIEMIVVLAIFTFITGTAVSIFISMLQNQNKALKEQELFSQVSYAAEYISRLIADSVVDEDGSCLGSGYAGYNYVLSHFDPVSGFYQGIKFISKESTCQEFFLDADGIFKEVKNSNSPQNILSNRFQVKYVRFIINGNKILQASSQNDLVQPRVTFLLNVKDPQSQQEKTIQTTVSQRKLNIQ